MQAARDTHTPTLAEGSAETSDSPNNTLLNVHCRSLASLSKVAMYKGHAQETLIGAAHLVLYHVEPIHFQQAAGQMVELYGGEVWSSTGFLFAIAWADQTRRFASGGTSACAAVRETSCSGPQQMPMPAMLTEFSEAGGPEGSV